MTQAPRENGASRAKRRLAIALLVEGELIRRGLEAVLAQLPIVSSAMVCKSVEDAHNADVLMVLASDPSWSDDIRSLTQHTPLKVLVMLDGVEAFSQATQATADGFVLQHQVTVESLGKALNQLACGDVPMPADLARMLLAHAGETSTRAPAQVPALTKRERETLQLLTDGLSNKQMGRRMGISEHGAKRLVASVRMKLNSPNRTAAVAVAIRDGLVHGDVEMSTDWRHGEVHGRSSGR